MGADREAAVKEQCGTEDAAGLNLVRTDKPVAIGDDYTDGKFYRDDSEVLTPLEEALLVQADMQEALNILGVT